MQKNCAGVDKGYVSAQAKVANLILTSYHFREAGAGASQPADLWNKYPYIRCEDKTGKHMTYIPHNFTNI